MKSTTEVVFSSDVANLAEWAQRTHIPLTTADALNAPYARAHRWLAALRTTLVEEYHWSDVSNDSRMLFGLETTSIWRSTVNLPAGPKLKLQLPVHASSFFTPDRRVQWEMVFHSDIFDSVRKICPPINDILYLLQCLLTGLVTVVFEEHEDTAIYRTTRGLPPVAWLNEKEPFLIEIFGEARLKLLKKACSDTKVAFKLDMVPHQ